MNSASRRNAFWRESQRLAGSSWPVGSAGPGRLAVGGRHHHPLEHRLDVPAAVDELDGQPVEQLGVGRPGPLRAEVVGRRHQPLAEGQLPEPVDHHPGDQRVLGPRPASGPGRAASRGGPLTSSGGRDAGTPGVHDRARVVHPVAARQHAARRGAASPSRPASRECGRSASSIRRSRSASSFFCSGVGSLIAAIAARRSSSRRRAAACSGSGTGVGFLGADDRLLDVGEEGGQAVELAGGERVVLVVVALGTAHGHAHPDRRDVAHPVGGVLGDVLLGLGPALLGRLEQPVVARGDARLVGRRGTRSPASCSIVNRSNGLLALNERIT